jgi:hypothetical protein
MDNVRLIPPVIFSQTESNAIDSDNEMVMGVDIMAGSNPTQRPTFGPFSAV